MASLKLCLHTGSKKQIKRSRVDSLADFSFSALKKIAMDTFGELSHAAEFGYEDEDKEIVSIANDTDLAECVAVMGVSATKTLRIEITVPEQEATRPALAVDTGASRDLPLRFDSCNNCCSLFVVFSVVPR